MSVSCPSCGTTVELASGSTLEAAGWKKAPSGMVCPGCVERQPIIPGHRPYTGAPSVWGGTDECYDCSQSTSGRCPKHSGNEMFQLVGGWPK